MTVSTTATKVTTQGNGATTAWPFTFAVQDEDEIVVTLTESDGTVTELPSSAYSVTINAASGTNPTSVGGTVTYPLSGSPVALGDYITVQREAALTQPTSLANQGISWQSTIEAALDYLTFQTQQLNFQIGQQFSVPVSDDPPAVLPVASERASMLAGFDSDGNMIAVALTDAGQVMVSSAMIPVVEAASLALARTELGLGDIATQDIGAGLQADGSGNARVNFVPAADAGNQAVVAGFHLTDRHATGALTYTNPAASTLFAGFGYWVSALTAAVTFAIDAGDSFSGAGTGTSLIIQPGTQVYISTDGTNTWFVREISLVGMGTPLNAQINAAVSASAMTISLKDRNGNDPSTASPVLIPFRDPTIANGNPVVRAVTSALSIVIPSTATLGTTNGVANRVWVVAFDNGGSIVLGAIICSTATRIYTLDETVLVSPTTVIAGSNTAGVFYSGAAVAASKAFRILGYVESTQATAGTWATSPSKIQLFGPGVRKPGDTIQARFLTNAVAFSLATSTTMTATNLVDTILLTSAANIVKVTGSGQYSTDAGAIDGRAQILRGSTGIGAIARFGDGESSSTVVYLPVTLVAIDKPNATSGTYSMGIAQNTSSASAVGFSKNNFAASLLLEELMG